MAARLEPAIGAEAARWGDNPNTRQGVRDYRKSHWLSARNNVLNSFLPNRPAIAMAQYRAANLYPAVDAPEFSQHGGVLDPPSVVTFIDPPEGNIYYTTDGSDPRVEGGGVHPGAGSLIGGSVTETFVDFEEAGWRYLVTPTGLGDSDVVDGSPPHPDYGPAHWKHPDFDDSAWPAGQALLGYGTITGTAVRTVIGYGGDLFNRYPTTYFRKTFNVTGAAMVSKLLVNIVRDDGAILYINGREIGRSNMDPGDVSYGEYAVDDSNPENEIIPFTYTLPSGVLREGANVLAIELHQETANSSDLGIDAEVRGAIVDSGISLSGSSVVKARVLSTANEWSALTEAFFTVAATPASAASLAISKIHYRPAEPSPSEKEAGFDDRGDFEFLELVNHGDDTALLTGVTIGGGISFAFAPDVAVELAPGERAVIVANAAAFRMRYGAGPRLLGEFQRGNLSDDGEEIVVNDENGETMWRFTYNDAGAWPDSPDGDGPALVLVNPDNPPTNAMISSPESWRPSVTIGGAPGSDDRIFLSSWLAARPDPDPLADPDGDGINQLIAFTTGALDGPGGHSFLPSVSMEEIDVAGVVDLYPVLRVRLLTGGEGVTTSLLQSSDLPAWEAADLVLSSSTDNGDGTLTRRYRARIPYHPNLPDTADRLYFQLSVATKP